MLDIDGVLADVRHRLHHVARTPKDWGSFFAAAPDDPLLPQGRILADELTDRGLQVIYLTGRPERCRADTDAWLHHHSLPAGELHMRGDADRRPARLTKLELLRDLSRRGTVSVVVDDDRAVVNALQQAGFQVLHATWMGGGSDGVDGAVLQEALFDAQEGEGRT